MTKNRKKRTKRSRSHTPVSGDVGKKLRIALRSIIRDWNLLSKSLLIDESNEDPKSGAQRFRIRGADCYEELQEKIVEFAGQVWQLKDGLINWLKTQPNLEIVISIEKTNLKVVGKGGQDAERTIEEAAKINTPLLLCADLFNTHKHYTDCNRSGYQPFLSGVKFDTSKSGVCGIIYDGPRRTGDITVSNPNPVKMRIEILSRNQPVNLGDAVVNVGRAFKYWIPIIRQMNLLSPNNREDQAILEDIAVIDQDIDNLNPFPPDATVIDFDQLPIELQKLADTNPAEFIRKIKSIDQ